VRVRAGWPAAAVLELAAGELAARLAAGSLGEVAGIGPVTAGVISQAAAGQEPDYLAALRAEHPPSARTGLRAALRGDCRAHSDWSDGGSPPREMAEAARGLGHEWLALTDHLVSELNADLAPFRVLTGIEVDILDDGTLDQRADLLARLDVVVASVHSHLRMPSGPMTERMVAAVRNPSARTRPAGCSRPPPTPAAGSPSTRTPTRPASSTGSAAAAAARRSTASRRTASSTPAAPTP
jgi:putative hydrolase